MEWERLDKSLLEAFDHALGYLNLSGGSEDTTFLRGLNAIWTQFESPTGAIAEFWRDEAAPPTFLSPLRAVPAGWRRVVAALRLRLAFLSPAPPAPQHPAFASSEQVSLALDWVVELVEQYRQFHHVLLQHLDESELVNAFLLGRFFEALLRQGITAGARDRVLQGALNSLNDFVGHRPVPNLEGHSTRPYPHEFVRPVPLLIRGVGTAYGPYQELLDQVIAILSETDDAILESVQFDLEELRELAFDPRAYDFEHPVHRRPGYQFGEWDPHAIGENKHYFRFVIRKEMLDIVLRRVQRARDETQRKEWLVEAAAVTAGSLLVAAGVSGRGPESHDSNTSFATLVPRLGRCRDAFYLNLLHRIAGDHAERLQRQAQKDGQPFNDVRQHLNEALSRRNAVQKIRLKLAEIFAQMGYPARAQQQLAEVPVVSARVRGDLACLLIQVADSIDASQLLEAQQSLQQVIRRVREGIECGALVDPRNMLGFDCQFSLFPAVENSIFDHRVETLLEIVHDIFRLAARVWSEAAAGNNVPCAQQAEKDLREFAEWWHTFAAHEVRSVDGESAMLRLVAAQNVAEIVRRWVQAGAASGDVAFWAPHAEAFRSPQAYVQVIDVLLKHQDHVASMGLLMHWLGNESVSLERSEASFGQLAHRWLSETLSYSGRDGSHEPTDPPNLQSTNWALAAKFFDFLEANSGEYWSPPELLDDGIEADPQDESESWQEAESEDPDDGLFSAAYEEVVYQDSTNDGIEGPLFESPQEDDTHFDREAERLASRLLFLYRVAGLWKTACMACIVARQQGQDLQVNPLPQRFAGWIENSATMRRGLRHLTTQLRYWKLPAITEDPESLSRYDHRRAVRDSLLEQTVATITALREAELLLRSCDRESIATIRAADSSGFPKRDAVLCLDAIFTPASQDQIGQALLALLEKLRGRHLIHIAIYRGGSCKQSVTAHTCHAFLRTLVWHLPRLGQVANACRLLETLRRREGRAMGRAHTISHFNRLFELACRSIFETTARAAAAESHESAAVLCEKMESIAETLLIPWVRYSRSLRLSVVERFLPRSEWEQARQFIERFGQDLFTKDKLDLGLLRGILHQGVFPWFQQMEAHLPEDEQPQILHELKQLDERRTAARTMSAILETLSENFDEFSEFHSTTSKADRGELTYVLIDFLRLRCEYRRVAWNLWPFVLAHAAIVQAGLTEVAELWESRLAERVQERAEHFMTRLLAMEDKYGVSLPSIREVITEQFVRPMHINRLLGDAQMAMQGGNPVASNAAFERLEQACETLLDGVTGAHRGMPDWLERIGRLTQPHDPHTSADLAVGDVGNMPHLPPPQLDEIVSQVLNWRESLQGFPPVGD